MGMGKQGLSGCYAMWFLKRHAHGNVNMLHSTAQQSVFFDASTVEMFESLDGQTEAER